MKYLKVIIILALLLKVSISFSQNYGARKNAKATSVQGLDPLQLARIHQQNNYQKQLQRNANEPYFIESKNNAVTAYRDKNYEQCIYYYESSKKMGFYNGEFEYVAGVSYNELAKQIGNKQFKSKAKKLLKKAKKHGYVLAIPYLNRNF